MAGWRVGFAVGNATAIEAINLVQDHLFVSLFPAIQEAAIEALLGDQQNVTDLVARYEKRRNALISGCQAIGWDVVAPQGSFLLGYLFQTAIQALTSQRYYLMKQMLQ